MGERRDVSTVFDLGARAVNLNPQLLLPRGKIAPDTQWLGGWVGFRAVWTLWRKEKPCPCREATPDFQPAARLYTD
jgi:hypothetical protein